MNRVIAQTGVQYPIVQAPMGWIARAPLASAVSNAGGLGIIETSSGETDHCIAEIAKMRDLTDRPFGINLPLLFLRDAPLVRPDERRVGKGWVRTCRSRWSPDH